MADDVMAYKVVAGVGAGVGLLALGKVIFDSMRTYSLTVGRWSLPGPPAPGSFYLNVYKGRIAVTAGIPYMAFDKVAIVGFFEPTSDTPKPYPQAPQTATVKGLKPGNYMVFITDSLNRVVKPQQTIPVIGDTLIQL